MIPGSNDPPLPTYRLPLEPSVAPATAIESAEDGNWSEPLLHENAIWFCKLRWIVVAVLTVVGLAGFFPQTLEAVGLVLPPGWPLGTAALLALLNIVFRRLARASELRGFPSMRLLLWTQIFSDLLILTAVIRWVDRDLPAAPFMYLFHLILACIVFPPIESLMVAVLSAGFYLAGLQLEATGLAMPFTILSASASKQPSLSLLVLPMLIIWVVIWYLVSRLAEIVRRRERELAVTNRRLEASGEERARHMLQTTHQLKAPFAAIHAQTQLLLGGYCGELPPAARSVAEKISSRCLALSRQIQEMLQLVNLRSQGQLAPPRSEINLGEALTDVIARIEPTARQRGIRIQKEIQPVRLSVVADHLVMLLDNIVVNAVNYSHDQGLVEVNCRPGTRGEAEVVVRDHGIGIPEAKLPRIFEDYYRTDDAVKHNRSSTGLGLAVVRQVAQQLKANLQVESAPGWGTRFTVRLPSPRLSPVSSQTQPH